MAKRIIKSGKILLEATQAKISTWFQEIDTAITRASQKGDYEKAKAQLLPKLIEAVKNGVPLRELETITGIPYQTIAKWVRKELGIVNIRQARKEAKKELQDARQNASEQ